MFAAWQQCISRGFKWNKSTLFWLQHLLSLPVGLGLTDRVSTYSKDSTWNHCRASEHPSAGVEPQLLRQTLPKRSGSELQIHLSEEQTLATSRMWLLSLWLYFSFMFLYFVSFVLDVVVVFSALVLSLSSCFYLKLWNISETFGWYWDAALLASFKSHLSQNLNHV